MKYAVVHSLQQKEIAYNIDVGAGGGSNTVGSDTVIDEAGTLVVQAKGGGTTNSRPGGSGGGGAYGNSLAKVAFQYLILLKKQIMLQ